MVNNFEFKQMNWIYSNPTKLLRYEKGLLLGNSNEIQFRSYREINPAIDSQIYKNPWYKFALPLQPNLQFIPSKEFHFKKEEIQHINLTEFQFKPRIFKTTLSQISIIEIQFSNYQIRETGEKKFRITCQENIESVIAQNENNLIPKLNRLKDVFIDLTSENSIDLNYNDSISNLQQDNEKNTFQEIEDLQQLQKILRVSKKIRLDMMQKALNMAESQFYQKIFDWADQFNFQIDGDYVIINHRRLNEFLSSLDSLFLDWNQNEQIKE